MQVELGCRLEGLVIMRLGLCACKQPGLVQGKLIMAPKSIRFCLLFLRIFLPCVFRIVFFLLLRLFSIFVYLFIGKSRNDVARSTATIVFG